MNGKALNNLVPDYILSRFRRHEYEGEFNAATLFLDISGFTHLTEVLMEKGTEGAEIISHIINRLYEPMIREIYAEDGYISTFAGDAFTAIFPKDARSSLLAAWKIQEWISRQSEQETRFGTFLLHVKQGLSYGKVSWGIVGEKRIEYYFRNEAIDACAVNEQNAGSGDIVFDLKFLQEIRKELKDYDRKKINFKYHIRYGNKYILEDFRLKGVEEQDDSKRIPLDSESELNDTQQISDQIDAFLHPELLRGEIKPEFRHVNSVFINFRSTLSFNLEKHENLNRFMTTVLGLAEDYGAYVSSLDFGDKGSKILLFFGLPVAYDNNLDRALNFSLSLREQYGENVRLGITQGKVYAGLVGSKKRSSYTGLGDAVNLSARIMGVTEWGKIFCDSYIYTSASNSFSLSFVMERKFKGKSNAEKIYRLEGKISEQIAARFDDAFINRSLELKESRDIFDQALDSQSARLVFISGDGGIGKTRFVYESSRDKELNFCFLPSDAILKKSLNPFIRYLQEFFLSGFQGTAEERELHFTRRMRILQADYAQAGADAELISNLERRASMIAALLGIYQKESLYFQLDAQARMENTFLAIKDFFYLQSTQRPQLLFFEDFQSMDQDSRDIVERMLPFLKNSRVLIIAASRSTNDSGNSFFEFDRNIFHKSFYLEGLKKEDLKKKIENFLQKKISNTLTDFIYEKTDGNPFYTEQFLIYLQDTGALQANAEGIVEFTLPESGDIPDGISNLLVARIDRFSRALKSVIQSASIIGKEFSQLLLARISELDRLEEIIAEGVNLGVWQKLDDHTILFDSDLLRQAAYDMQLKATVRMLHGKVADAMQEIYSDDWNHYADIAYHYDRAEKFDQAFIYYEKAFSYARENYKNFKALEFVNRLLELSESSEKKISLMLDKVTVLELMGRWDDALEILALSDSQYAQKDAFKPAIFLSKADILQKRGSYEEALKSADEGIALLSREDLRNDIAAHQIEGQNDKRILADLYRVRGRTFWSSGAYEQSLHDYNQAKTRYLQLGYEQGIALSEYFMGVDYRDKGEYEQAMQYYQSSLERFEKLDDRRYKTYPLYDIGVLYQFSGDLKKSEKYFRDTAEIYEEIGYQSGLSAALLNIGVIKYKSGDLEGALLDHQRSLEIVETLNEKLAIAYTIFSMAVVYFYKQDYSLAIHNLRKSLEIMIQIGSKGYFGYVYSYLSYLYAKSGKINQCLRTANRHRKNISTTGSDVEHGLTDLAVAISLWKLSEKEKQGFEKSSALLRELNKFRTTYSQEVAPEYFFEKAIAESEQADYMTTYIPALLDYGEYLFQIGKKEESVKFFDKALRKSKEKGMDLHSEIIRNAINKRA